MNHRIHLERAIKIMGSQQALADAIGMSQQGVSYVLHSAPRITAEAAVAIERATKGAVRREQLRPDIFGDAA